MKGLDDWIMRPDEHLQADEEEPSRQVDACTVVSGIAKNVRKNILVKQLNNIVESEKEKDMHKLQPATKRLQKEIQHLSLIEFCLEDSRLDGVTWAYLQAKRFICLARIEEIEQELEIVVERTNKALERLNKPTRARRSS